MSRQGRGPAPQGYGKPVEHLPSAVDRDMELWRGRLVPPRAQGAPPDALEYRGRMWVEEVVAERRVAAALGPVLLLLLGLAAEMSDHDAPFNRQGWLAPLNEAIALIDARLAAIREGSKP